MVASCRAVHEVHTGTEAEIGKRAAEHGIPAVNPEDRSKTETYISS